MSIPILKSRRKSKTQISGILKTTVAGAGDCHSSQMMDLLCNLLRHSKPVDKPERITACKNSPAYKTAVEIGLVSDCTLTDKGKRLLESCL